MDKFEEMIQKIQKMGEAERTATLDKARSMCVCGRCPTYNDCMKGKKEAMFCWNGKSSCKPPKKGCLCQTCPVTPMMGLKHGIYCVNGPEREIRKI